MAPKSTYLFDRWKAQSSTTWAYTLYGKYDDELTRIGSAHFTASKFIYKSLGEAGVSLEDKPSEMLGFSKDEVNRYSSIKIWSDEYNSFSNWVNLNSLLTLVSNFETYLASIVQLAIDSDPGVVFGASRSIDGVYLKKYNKNLKLPKLNIVEECTKGDWSSRIDAFERYFDSLSEFRAAHTHLEKMRNIRNEIGHAFGRDINASRSHGQLRKIPIRNFNHDRFRRYQKIIRLLVRAIDSNLLDKHIGEYEIIDFHNKHQSMYDHLPLHQRVWNLKKAVGKFGSEPRGKHFCGGLIEYLDNL